MGLLQKLLNGNADLIEWQNAVMPDKSEKLYVTRKQLEATTIQVAMDCMRIFDDSANIINSTTKPDVFFSRLELAEEKLTTLAQIEPYMAQVKAIDIKQSMADLLNEFQNNRYFYIGSFLNRYYCAVKEKAEGMKTEKGKLNQFQKFKESLEPHTHHFNLDNMTMFEAMCKQEI